MKKKAPRKENETKIVKVKKKNGKKKDEREKTKKESIDADDGWSTKPPHKRKNRKKRSPRKRK